MTGLRLLGAIAALMGLASCGILPFTVRWVVSETYVSQLTQVSGGARVGQPVEIHFNGSGSNGCYSADRVDVRVDDTAQVVRLRAYVKQGISRGSGCSQAFVTLPMSATFWPQRAGTYRIEALVGGQSVGSELVTVAEVHVTE